MKKELLELARKKGVVIRSLTWTNKWVAHIIVKQESRTIVRKKLSTLIKFLADNKIKINN